MILKGKNLIISANGIVIAGAKSCDIEVNCDTIPVSSPTSGDWEDSIPGRKSWKVTTNHLVMSAAAMGAIGGFGYACYSGAYVIAAAVLVLAILAFPTIKDVWKKWQEC